MSSSDAATFDEEGSDAEEGEDEDEDIFKYCTTTALGRKICYQASAINMLSGVGY